MTTLSPPLHDTRHETIDGEVRQVVHSPEQVALHLAIAGPASRMLAYAIDATVIMLVEAAVVVGVLLSSPLIERLAGPLRRWTEQLSKGNPGELVHGDVMLLLLAIALLVQFVIEWGYFFTWEMLSGGRSLGKLVVKLRVVRDGGGPLSFRESLVRNLLRMADLLPASYAVGLIAMVLSSEGKRLGDLAAGTIVIRLDRAEPAPPLRDPVTEGLDQFRFDHSHVARVGSTERALLRQTLRRLETLSPQQAELVLEQTTEALRERIGYTAVAAPDRHAFLYALLRAVARQ